MKRKPKDLTRKEFIVTLDTLYTAASAVKGRDAVKSFLKDLLTPSERVMLGRRIIIARLLIAGETYDEICRRMKVGKTTVSKVDRWLNDQFPGYEDAVKGLEKEFADRSNKYPEPFSFAWLKKKYPLHFLLFPQPKTKRQTKAEMYPKQ